MGIIHTLHHTLVVSDSTYGVIISLISTAGFYFLAESLQQGLNIKTKQFMLQSL